MIEVVRKLRVFWFFSDGMGWGLEFDDGSTLFMSRCKKAAGYGRRYIFRSFIILSIHHHCALNMYLSTRMKMLLISFLYLIYLYCVDVMWIAR